MYISHCSKQLLLSNGGNDLNFHQKVFSGQMTFNAVADALALLVDPGVPHLRVKILLSFQMKNTWFRNHSNNQYHNNYDYTRMKSTPFMGAKSLLMSFNQIRASRMLLLFVPTSAKSFSI